MDSGTGLIDSLGSEPSTRRNRRSCVITEFGYDIASNRFKSLSSVVIDGTLPRS